MQSYMSKRAVKIGMYIVANDATVRKAGESFGISKSTVHNDVVRILPKVNSRLARQVRAVLNKNKEESHIRGGEATRLKYAKRIK
ncbi:MAG: sporulation transcriptional regulator SpoIIID [Deltaproteobacteria bacterium]